MSDKPLVFNYKEYDTLRDKCNDMAVTIEELQVKVQKQMWEVMKVKGENTTLKCELENVQSKYDAAVRIIEIQQDTISTYGKVFKLQEAELQKLRLEAQNDRGEDQGDNEATA